MITTVWERETSAARISTSATAAVTILCVVPVQCLPNVALQVRPALGGVLEEVVVARASEVVAADWYNESRARAFAAIAAAAECGPEGAFGLNPWTCPECEAAGFALLPDKTFISRKDFDTSDALFAYVATMTSAGRGDRSRENVDLKQPACVLSFRGTDNFANWKRNFQICNQSVLEAWPEASPCVGCGVHKGFYKIYDGLYHGEGGIYATLVKLGCGPRSGRQVFVTGHSLGGGIAPLAMFDL